MKKQQQPLTVRYRIYISDGGIKFYLRDIIAHEHKEHYLFDVDRRYAMVFKSWDMAMRYRKRMILLNYHPHIEQV